MQATEDESGELELDPLTHRQPVEVPRQRRDVLELACRAH